MEKLEVPATNRASFYIYNTKQEVDVLIDSLDQVAKVFKL
jgi:cysteine desulfurase/selenocysteine lyase